MVLLSHLTGLKEKKRILMPNHVRSSGPLNLISFILRTSLHWHGILLPEMLSA